MVTGLQPSPCLQAGQGGRVSLLWDAVGSAPTPTVLRLPGCGVLHPPPSLCSASQGAVGSTPHLPLCSASQGAHPNSQWDSHHLLRTPLTCVKSGLTF